MNEHTNDNSNILWGVIGCIIPIAGLILFLSWRETRPNAAKVAGIGALIGLAVSIILPLIDSALGLGIFSIFS